MPRHDRTVASGQDWLTTTTGHCVPTAIASLLGTTLEDAAEALHQHDPKCLVPSGGTRFYGDTPERGWGGFLASMGCVIVTGSRAERPDADERWRAAWVEYRARRGEWYEGLRWNPPAEPSYAKTRRFTVAQWLRAHPNTNAILRIDSHAFHVDGGAVVADTLSRSMMRARVISWAEMPTPTEAR